MMMDSPCNLYAPAGTTPMTIADAILRECDQETLEEVLHYIDCYLKRHGFNKEEEEHNTKDYGECQKCVYGVPKDDGEYFCSFHDMNMHKNNTCDDYKNKEGH